MKVSISGVCYLSLNGKDTHNFYNAFNLRIKVMTHSALLKLCDLYRIKCLNVQSFLWLSTKGTRPVVVFKVTYCLFLLPMDSGTLPCYRVIDLIFLFLITCIFQILIDMVLPIQPVLCLLTFLLLMVLPFDLSFYISKFFSVPVFLSLPVHPFFFATNQIRGNHTHSGSWCGLYLHPATNLCIDPARCLPLVSALLQSSTCWSPFSYISQLWIVTHPLTCSQSTQSC